MLLPITATLTALTDHITEAGIRADLDPAQLSLPAVWVRPTAVALDLLAATSIAVELVCIVPDTDHRRALEALEALAGMVLDLIDAGGDVLLTTVQLPEQPSPLPALVIPTTLHADQ